MTACTGQGWPASDPGRIGSGLLPGWRARRDSNPNLLTVGLGTSSRTVRRGPCAGPTFQGCSSEAGVVRRHGSRFGSSQARLRHRRRGRAFPGRTHYGIRQGAEFFNLAVELVSSEMR